jgi:hypothetical protein
MGKTGGYRLMLNIVLIFGPQGMSLRFTFKTEAARQEALAHVRDMKGFDDDIGQSFVLDEGIIHAIVLTSDQSEAQQMLAPHNIQMAASKIVEERDAAEPLFKSYLARVRRAQASQQMGGGGGTLPIQ